MTQTTDTRNYPAVETSDEIKTAMKFWRMGATGIPTAYVAFHKELARNRLVQLTRDLGWTVHKVWTENDGWGDAMRVLFAIVETDGKLLKVKWHDGNQCFFANCAILSETM